MHGHASSVCAGHRRLLAQRHARLRRKSRATDDAEAEARQLAQARANGRREVTIFLAIIIGVLVVALIALSAFIVWGDVQTRKDATAVFHEAVARSRSADETIAKNLPVLMQTAAAVSDRVDARAAARVQLINSAIAGVQPTAADAGTTAATGDMPPIYQSPMQMETREQIREDQRLRRPGADDVRDTGIGQDGSTMSDIPPIPPVRTEAL